MRVLPLLVAALLCPAAAHSQSVAVQRGNVVYQATPQSSPRPLTSSGRDRDPRLSPDGKTVAFVRGTPADLVETATERGEATELWIVGVDGRDARLLARGRAAERPEQALAGFQSPRFSPDGRRIYFLSTAWATSSAVHAVEVASGQERYLLPGNSLDLLPSGRYAGHLLVEQHRYFLAGGSYDWTWLFTPEGVEVGPVGETEGALSQFREMYAEP